MVVHAHKPLLCVVLLVKLSTDWMVRLGAAATIKGTMKVGLNLLIISVHPMRRGATLMSSILFNVALVLVACLAVIQFCAQAFALYAYETAIYEIFTNQVLLSSRYNIRDHVLVRFMNSRMALEKSVRYSSKIMCDVKERFAPAAQVLNLQGLGWLYRQSFFLYCLFGVVGLSIVWFCVKGPEPFKRRTDADAWKE